MSGNFRLTPCLKSSSHDDGLAVVIRFSEIDVGHERWKTKGKVACIKSSYYKDSYIFQDWKY